MTTRTRIGGSARTVLMFGGKVLASLTGFTDKGEAFVAAPEYFHPLHKAHPVEHVVPAATSGGEVQVTVKDVFNLEFWQHLAKLHNQTNIREVISRQYALKGGKDGNTAPYIVVRTIRNGQGQVVRTKIYHNVFIIPDQNSETVQIGTVSLDKTMTVRYTHSSVRYPSGKKGKSMEEGQASIDIT